MAGRGMAVRSGVVAGVLLILAGASLWLAGHGPGAMPLTCMFHEITGLHCAGCGLTRATHAVFEGRFVDAFRFNPLGVVLLPLALAALVPEIVGWVRGAPPRWRVPLGRRGAIVLIAVVLAYTVVRNLPWAPFTWLAPG